MKICHELPVSLLSESERINDYEYCLPRFWHNNKAYKKYYSQAKKDGRFIILDNGLFEGDNFSFHYLVELINELKPDIFIVPDAWNNKERTYLNALHWMKILKPQLPEETELMVVMQGENMREIAELYKACKNMGYKYLSFNHSSNAYSNLFRHPNKLISQMMGRVYIVSHLREQGIIQDDHYIHLLGCSLPQEFLYYPKEWEFIKSVDTSNPIILGLLGRRYESWGLLDKPNQKLEEFMKMEGREVQIAWEDDIIHNIYNFKKFVEHR